MTSQPFRLAAGGRIDRTKTLRFFFNGRPLEGFAGDTVASALLANGVRLVGRSFKYHRPRGILSHGSDEPNALLQVDRGPGRTEPNNRATVIPLADGLRVASQNHWPSLKRDLGALGDVLSPLLPAGFYYKTFMWPQPLWHRLYEPLIRRMAGLGVAPSEPDADRYDHHHAHCDVLVVGAGPAGLAAALAASEEGRHVILADEQAEMGGSLLHDAGRTINGLAATDWLASSLAALAARANVILLPRTTAFGYYNHNHLGLAERVADGVSAPVGDGPRERLWQVRAARVVLATGALERPLTFPDNDRPGVMLAESIRAYVNRYGVLPGRRIVFVTSGASAYIAAAEARAAGAQVTIVELRRERDCGAELSDLHALGVEVLADHRVVGSTGRQAVTGLVVRPGSDGGVSRRLPCDCVGMSGGWTPSVHLFSQSRGKLRYEMRLDAFVPDRSVQQECSAGAAAGTWKLADCLTQGEQAGRGAADSHVRHHAVATAPPDRTGFTPFRPPTGAKAPRRRAFVDFQNDVTAKDIELAVREGFRSVEHIKRYTTTGMATDQGKTSNMATMAVAAEALGQPASAVGLTTFRPPYTPVTFGTLVGPQRRTLFDPVRKTPLHERVVAHGAVFENVGLWRRAWYFPRTGETMDQAVRRECRVVRSAVGQFDGSTLGKIEVVGPDAAEFLNRIYVNSWKTLSPGRCRYGIMLRENGYVFDDGVVARLAEDRFHVTTTTGGAARVLAHMEDYLQTEWPDLRVFLTSTTEEWSVIAVQGPQARAVIAPLLAGIDLSPEAFPHMAVRSGTICGVPTRLFRVSFTGELGYEINVPAGEAGRIWNGVHAAGQRFGIVPYGSEAMHVLRAERGFIAVGQETDGTVTVDDLGLSGMIAWAKPDFVGKRSLAMPDLVSPDRLQLIGLLTERPDLVLATGAQVVAGPSTAYPVAALGHVTSSYWSETCQRSIALALVVGGRRRIGDVLYATTDDGFVRLRVTAPVFHDPQGECVHG